MSNSVFDESGTGLLEKPRAKTERPRKYQVLMFNDDYTPADFVVGLLMKVFRMDPEKALAITMDVHYRGIGVCGVYPKDVAETKTAEATEIAKAAGHVLKLDTQPE